MMELELLLLDTWYGCRLQHPRCLGAFECHEIGNLQVLLKHVKAMRHPIQRLHTFNLGTEWLPFLRDDTLVVQNLSPLSPATTVDLHLHSNEFIHRLSVRSCALHDLVWFDATFHHLEELSLSHVSARHSQEVDLFATTLDQQLFPRLHTLRLISSDFSPSDYFHFFSAIRKHERIRAVNIENVHCLCIASSIGREFTFELGLPRGRMQQDLARYMEGDDVDGQCMEQSWLKMFQVSGTSSSLNAALIS